MPVQIALKNSVQLRKSKIATWIVEIHFHIQIVTFKLSKSERKNDTFALFFTLKRQQKLKKNCFNHTKSLNFWSCTGSSVQQKFKADVNHYIISNSQLVAAKYGSLCQQLSLHFAGKWS